MKVTAIESPLSISEIKSGTNGWIEIKNNSARTIDISGFGISVSNSKPFFMPPKTIISPWAENVFGSDVLKFTVPYEGDVILLYPNVSVLLKISYKSSMIADDESLNWTGVEWIIAKATPGEKNNIKESVPKTTVSKNTQTKTIANNSIQKKTSIIASAPNKISNNIVNLSDDPSNQFSASVVDLSPKLFGGYLWLIIGIGGGVVAGFLFLVIKRIISSN